MDLITLNKLISPQSDFIVCSYLCIISLDEAIGIVHFRDK